MARTHGRIYSRIWDDDFAALTVDAQRAYLFLISQSDLTQAGVLGLRLKRWARLAMNSTADSIRADLAELEQARYIVVDDDTEEVLVRTFIRNDQVYRQPNVMLRAVEDCREITSARIKATMLAELDRIPLDELSSEMKNGKSARSVGEGAIATMRKVLSDGIQPEPAMPEGVSEPIANPSGNPSLNPPGTLPATPAAGFPEPTTRTRDAPPRAPVAPNPDPRSPVPRSPRVETQSQSSLSLRASSATSGIDHAD